MTLIKLGLFLLTVLFVAILQLVHLPAATLIGSICAAIVVSVVANAETKLPKILFFSAQSIVGCMIARIFTMTMLASMVNNWKLVLFSSVSMIICGFALGWVMTVRRIFPGSTAVWGSSPGAATAMVIISEYYGADTRMVAFMQYTRVLIVALAASILGMFFGVSHTENVPLLQYYFPTFDGFNLAVTIAFAAICVVLARLTKISGGPLVISMFLGAMLNNIGVLSIELPQWLLTICYVIIGWNIGLRFTRTILAHALHVLPQVLLSVLVLLSLCGIIMLIMVHMGVDPLTAYLAASPGGADSVAIISASIDVDMAFIMSVQYSRFLLIMIIGPHVAKAMGAYFLKREAANSAAANKS
ncbi:MAG: AbrB family transcriptional regulator [Deferribacteraceae bacterium]|jgi:membrane AbrB-like protein|nr:AbrB family transcriptional regulator [Deferribacteraceae bacterium]